jgi:hypothetical protein
LKKIGFLSFALILRRRHTRGFDARWRRLEGWAATALGRRCRGGPCFETPPRKSALADLRASITDVG